MVNTKLLLSKLLVIWQCSVIAQNLLPNSSFEEINTCCEREAPCSPEGWFAQRIYPYQRNFISMEPVYKNAFSGNTCIELEVGSDYIPRKYAFRCAVAPLLMPLVQGKKYIVTVNVMPKLYAIRELHAVFSDTIFPNLYQSQPDLTFTHKDRKFIIDGRNWVELQTIYEAKGGERFMHIGMIKPLMEMDYKRLTENKGMGTYYLDDISLVPLEAETAFYNLDSARQFIYNENRRHDYDKRCGGSNVLFPSLLTSTFDSVTTLPGILKRKSHVLLNAKLEERFVFYQLTYLDSGNRLTPESYAIINPVLNRMKTNTSLFIVLKGFVSEENSDSNTYLLSLNHANAVASYLIEAGIEANRIQTIGMGNTDFIGNPDTPEGRALNNRVEYLLYEK